MGSQLWCQALFVDLEVSNAISFLDDDSYFAYLRTLPENKRKLIISIAKNMHEEVAAKIPRGNTRSNFIDLTAATMRQFFDLTIFSLELKQAVFYMILRHVVKFEDLDIPSIGDQCEAGLRPV